MTFCSFIITTILLTLLKNEVSMKLPHSYLSFPIPFSFSAGCQICGGEEEAAAGLPAHGDEQTDPDPAGVRGPPHQRDPAVSAAFLSVSGHI